jgi:hypothetical protein
MCVLKNWNNNDNAGELLPRTTHTQEEHTMLQQRIAREHLAVIEQIDGITLYPAYSGRGMYGRTCFGIVTDEPIPAMIRLTRTLMETCDIEPEETLDLLDALAEGACQDSMGLQSIIYWPHIRVEV